MQKCQLSWIVRPVNKLPVLSTISPIQRRDGNNGISILKRDTFSAGITILLNCGVEYIWRHAPWILTKKWAHMRVKWKLKEADPGSVIWFNYRAVLTKIVVDDFKKEQLSIVGRHGLFSQASIIFNVFFTIPFKMTGPCQGVIIRKRSKFEDQKKLFLFIRQNKIQMKLIQQEQETKPNGWERYGTDDDITKGWRNDWKI